MSQQPMKRYWVRNYELRDLGSWPEHQVSREHDPFGPGIPKQVYLAVDVEAVEKRCIVAENEICTATDQIPPDMEGDSLSTALIKLKDALAAKEAEVVRLNEVYENCKGLLLTLSSVKLSPEMCEKVGRFNLMLLAIHKEREQRGETN